MFGKVPGNQGQEFIKSVEIGDLSMRSKDIPIDRDDEPRGLEKFYSPPERRLTTPWLFCDRGFFRVDVAIIGPIPEEPKHNLTLGRSQSEAILEAIKDEIIFLREELRG